MKILTVFGTRPEAIKMAMLVKRLSADKSIDHKLCVTAQHRDMLDQVLNFFQIVPDYDLNIMKEGQTLATLTADILMQITGVYKEFAPDLVIVHGDTTTCFAASLAAFYLHIKIGHVEAGMRTFNTHQPFPEEINRVITGQLAFCHFAPTQTNISNLLNEGVQKDQIIETGNTVIDSLLFTDKTTKSFSPAAKKTGISKIYKRGKKIILVTGHRRENFGAGFKEICMSLKAMAEKYDDVEIIYPVHLNPNVLRPVRHLLKNIPNIHLLPPLEYPDFIFAMKKAWIILTDSGGIQEEAPSLGKPVLVMRNFTERPEAVIAGSVQLVGADKKRILMHVDAIYRDKKLYKKMSAINNPYGDGNATERIIHWIKKNRKKICS